MSSANATQCECGVIHVLEIRKVLGEESKRHGTDTIASRELSRLSKAAHTRKTKLRK